LGNKDVQGFEWLKVRVTKNDVLLSSPDIATRLAKYTDAQVVAGHHSVTPEYKKQKEKIHYLFTQNIIKKQSIDSLFDNRVSYVYISKKDPIFNKEISFSGLVRVYENDSVEIYQNAIDQNVSWN